MPLKPAITLEKDTHRNQVIIVYRFDYNEQLIGLIKQLPNTYWSQSKRLWYQSEKHFKLSETIKKTLKVTYPRGKPAGYFGDFISATAENEFSLFTPLADINQPSPLKFRGEKADPEASLEELY